MNTLTYIGDAQAPEQTALNKKQRKIFLPKVAEFFPLLFPLKFATKRLLRWLGLIKNVCADISGFPKMHKKATR